MAIRLIALDLDGTLLNDRREISPANRQALAEVAERGVQILITTGRRFDSARPLLGRLPCPAMVVASNGALIATTDGEILHRNFLPRRVATAVLETALSHLPFAVVIQEVAGRGQVVMQNNASPLGPIAWYTANAPEVLLQVPDLAASLTTDPVHVMFGGPPAVLDPIESLLASSNAAAEIHLTWTRYEARNICILDVLNRGCSKGEALRWFAQRNGIPPCDVMAIGDNFNDVEMLKFAGVPVLMGNAPAPLGRNGWPTTLSNLEDGVAVALRAHALTC
jgi:Cof subfamily protein (haloacid dehalogenase superfamily)